MKNILIGIALVGAVLGSVAFFGYSPFLKVVSTVFGSPAGTTFNNAKIAAVDITPSSVSATSSQILNTDSSNRYIESIGSACTGVGPALGLALANNGWALQAATTSVAGLGLAGNTNLAGNLPISTSTQFAYAASSTVSSGNTSSSDLWIWPSNTYLSFLYTATNTAACIAKVSYLPS